MKQGQGVPWSGTGAWIVLVFRTPTEVLREGGGLHWPPLKPEVVAAGIYSEAHPTLIGEIGVPAWFEEGEFAEARERCLRELLEPRGMMLWAKSLYDGS